MNFRPRPLFARLFRVLLPSGLALVGMVADGFAAKAPASANTAEKATSSAAPGKQERQAALSKIADQDLKEPAPASLDSLGSLSIGLPNNGRLLNGVRPEDGKLFELVAPDFSWGTEEAVAFLKIAAEKVGNEYKDTPPLHLGHMSRESGGYLSPHLSHQSGRDVDLGYYYTNKRAWYRRATWENLDVPRTWTFVRALITETDVEMIIMDRGLQKLLLAHATKQGESKAWLDRVFKGSGDRPAILKHLRGHDTHMHVRFFSPEAQRAAQRVYPLLLEKELVEPVVVFAQYKAKKGDTLGRIAHRYGTTVKAIQNANGLRSTTIQARRIYKIPRPGGPIQVQAELEFPDRELP